jgi:hypothetical protein
MSLNSRLIGSKDTLYVMDKRFLKKGIERQVIHFDSGADASFSHWGLKPPQENKEFLW